MNIGAKTDHSYSLTLEPDSEQSIQDDTEDENLWEMIKKMQDHKEKKARIKRRRVKQPVCRCCDCDTDTSLAKICICGHKLCHTCVKYGNDDETDLYQNNKHPAGEVECT